MCKHFSGEWIGKKDRSGVMLQCGDRVVLYLESEGPERVRIEGPIIYACCGFGVVYGENQFAWLGYVPAGEIVKLPDD